MFFPLQHIFDKATESTGISESTFWKFLQIDRANEQKTNHPKTSLIIRKHTKRQNKHF